METLTDSESVSVSAWRVKAWKRVAVLVFLFRSYPAFGAGLFDDLLGDVAGDGVVVGELHVVGAAGAGDGVELGLVVEHLGHGHLRFDDLALAAHLHAL